MSPDLNGFLGCAYNAAVPVGVGGTEHYETDLKSKTGSCRSAVPDIANDGMSCTTVLNDYHVPWYF